MNELISNTANEDDAPILKTEIAESQEAVAWMQIDINDKPTNLFFNSVPADDYHTYIPLYTTPPSVDALIAEIDGLDRIDFDEGGVDYPCSDGDNYRFDDVRAVLNKYRGAK